MAIFPVEPGDAAVAETDALRRIMLRDAQVIVYEYVIRLKSLGIVGMILCLHIQEGSVTRAGLGRATDSVRTCHCPVTEYVGVSTGNCFRIGMTYRDGLERRDDSQGTHVGSSLVELPPALRPVHRVYPVVVLDAEPHFITASRILFESFDELTLKGFVKMMRRPEADNRTELAFCHTLAGRTGTG